tara:strand:- start:118 stop:471 length:354 start_codon:yes stop_codon:yes gene_type:complete
MIRKGDRITFRPEWQDIGDDRIAFVAIEDEDGGHVRVEALAGLRLNPTQVVKTEWIDTNTDRTEDLHQSARDFMDNNKKPSWKEMSLDEWLMEYGEELADSVRKEGYKIMDAFDSVR